MIGQLIDNGMPMRGRWDVLYAVAKFDDTANSQASGLADLRAGARVEWTKASAIHGFRAVEAREARRTLVESPWGAGRPGWHIECSACRRLCWVPTFDIMAAVWT